MKFIDQDLELRGFWMGQWNERQGKSEARFANENQQSLQLASASNTLHLFARMSMMEALGQLAKDGSLLAPTHKHIGSLPCFCSCCTNKSLHAFQLLSNLCHCKVLATGFSDYKEALEKSLGGFLPAKYIFKV